MPKSVLIVDDSIAMRRAVEHQLQQAGFGELRVQHAGNGLEALELTRDQRFDLILCDLEMPVMGGLELLRELRAEPGAAPVLVIAAAGDGEGPFVEALLNGALGCLRKPFSRAQLQAFVGPLLAPAN